MLVRVRRSTKRPDSARESSQSSKQVREKVQIDMIGNISHRMC